MADNSEYTKNHLSNPAMIQAVALNKFQESLGGDKVIVDPNNTYCFLTNQCAEMVAASVRSMQENFDILYKARTTNMEELLRHVSDYDVVGVYSAPAYTEIGIIMDKQYLIDNAVVYNDNYKKVVIPADSVFTINNMSFGIYYPIEIRFNSTTESCSVVYGTTEENPLSSLANNTIEKHEYTQLGMKLVSFKIPVYQFAKTVEIDNLSSKSGFVKTLDFDDKFYAIRAYHYIDSTWKEISLSYSEEIYDVNLVTLKVIPNVDTNTLKVSIPQVYFNTNLIGTKIKIEIYTTKGELDIDVTSGFSENMSANFFPTNEKDTYSIVLDKVSTVLTVQSDKIIGGSNGVTFDEFRNMVINDTLHESVLISPADLEQYFSAQNMRVNKVIDNITNRMFYVYSTLTDGKNMVVPVSDVATKLDFDTLADINTIRTNLSNSYTILPTTLFKYDVNNEICIPATLSELTIIQNSSKVDKATIFNNDVYTKCPYHTLIVVDETPLAISYDLMNPIVSDLKYIKENTNITGQMQANAVSIKHLNNGVGGYRITFAVTKSPDLADIPEEDLLVYFSTLTSDEGRAVGMQATYLYDQDDDSIYQVDIATDYDIIPNTFRVTNLDGVNEGGILQDYIDLEADCTLLFMIKSKHIENNINIETLVEIPSYYTDFVFMVRQEMTVTFGVSLENYVFNNLDVVWSSQDYKKYTTTTYYTYTEDIYERDTDGKLVYSIVDGVLTLNKLHSKGDVRLDENGDPLIKYNIGDVILEDGNPIVETPRILYYYVDMMHFDARLFMSEDTIQKTFINNLTSNLQSLYDLLDDAQNRLIEQEKLYYKPVRTLGNAGYIQGSEIIRQPLQLSFAFKFYVKDFVAEDDTLLQLIRTSTINIIDEKLLDQEMSMGDLHELIKNKLSDYVDHIDILGLNGDPTLQTIIPESNDTQSSLGILLSVKDDDTFIITRDLALETVKSSGS